MTDAKTLDGTTVGFIGLGLMGRPMSLNLRKAGAELVIHNRSQAVVRELEGPGMTAADSPAAVARRAPVVVMMLSDTPAVERVLLGEGGVIEGLRPGSLVIDMGTTAATPTRRFAGLVQEAGADYVDAPVSGGQVGAEAATLTIMAGGTEAAFARALPLFRAMGRTITHVGGSGAGQVAKAANQIIVGLTIGAVAEALSLGRKAGVEPARLREALMGGFAASRILDLHGDRMARGDFRPGARSTTQRKDLAQALDLAAEVGLALPTTALTLELYDRLIAQGDGELDHSALYRLFA
jgi:2-hydroxy-3-oxopropionate reductase